MLVTLFGLGIWLSSIARCKGLLKVLDDVVDVLGTYRYPDKIRCDSAVLLLVIAELLMGCCPGVDS